MVSATGPRLEGAIIAHQVDDDHMPCHLSDL